LGKFIGYNWPECVINGKISEIAMIFYIISKIATSKIEIMRFFAYFSMKTGFKQNLRNEINRAGHLLQKHHKIMVIGFKLVEL